MRKAVRVTLFSLAGMALLLVIAGAILYWKIRSIDLDDIRARQLAKADSGQLQGAEAEPQPQSEPEPGPDVPKVMKGAVSKAEQLAGKPIKSADALDVAAILLDSELSLKEMYDLIGKSTDNLNTEEKQRIRDQLLEKLKPEEIEALRAITTDYGKGLVILDPDYPIELVGVKDEAERKRIRERLEEEGKKASSSAGSGPADAAGESGPTTETDTDTDTDTAGSAGGASGPELAAVIRKYEGKLEAVRASCIRDANAMTDRVIAAIQRMKDGEGSSSAGAAEDELMQEIAAVEAECEASFASVLRQAKGDLEQAGLSTAVLQTWRDEYAAAKEAAMSKAKQRISESIG